MPKGKNRQARSKRNRTGRNKGTGVQNEIPARSLGVFSLNSYSFGKPVGGFPDRTRVTLRYAANIELTSTVSPGLYVFSGNSPYDPDVTSTGAQPNLYDNWAAVYQYYICHATTIYVGPYRTSAATPRVVLCATRTASGLGTEDASGEMYATSFQATSNAGVKMTVTSEQRLGMPRSQLLACNFATTTSNPNYRWYWYLQQSSYDNSTSTTVEYRVIIDHDIEFFDRIDSILSLELRAKYALEQLQRRKVKVQKGISLDDAATAFQRLNESKRPEGPVLSAGSLSAGSVPADLESKEAEPGEMFVLVKQVGKATAAKTSAKGS